MTDAPRVVDIHTHILPSDIPDFEARFGYGKYITLVEDEAGATMLHGGEFWRRVDRRLYDVEARIEACDAAGVDVQVLSTVPVMFSYWTQPKDGAEIAAFINDHLAVTVAQHPQRFIGLGTVPLQDTDRAIAELHRCVSELGFAGIMIGSHMGEENLNSPELYPVFEAAADLGAAVLVHPWDMMGQTEMPDYWLAWLVGMPAETTRAICSMIFGGVFERLPSIRVAFAHGGGSFPGTLGRIQHGFEVLPEVVGADNPTPPSEYIGRFWVDSIVHDSHQLQNVASVLGFDRVCLGSDFPFRLGEHEPGMTIRSARLSDGETARMLGTNALEWLGRRESPRD